MKRKLDHKELYEAAVADNAQTPVADLAKNFGLKAPLLTHYVMVYADEHELPTPKFCYKRKQDVVLKKLQRSPGRDWRVSALQSEKSGQSDVLAGRLVGVPTHKLICLVPDELNISSLEELIAYLQSPGAGVSGSVELAEVDETPVSKAKAPVRNLRMPVAGNSGKKKLAK